MKDEEIIISTVDELYSLLGKAYWIETQLEKASYWAAYITVKDQEYRDVIFRISHDSEKHKTILEGIFSKMKGLDPVKAVQNAGLKDKEFDFKGKRDEEIIKELLQYENLMLDLYTRLFTYSDKKFIQKIWRRDSPENFFKQLESLIAEEKKHVELLSPIADRIKRY